MFAIGFFILVFVLLMAAVFGKDAPDWIKVTGSFGFIASVLLMTASLAIGLWEVLP